MKKYTQLQDIKDPWARKMVFEDFREDFLGYVVTVSKTNVLRHFEEDDLKKGFNYISPEEVENVYDAETGFIQGEQIQYFI